MKLRLMATAFLFRGDQVLLLKRGADRKLAPGLWTGVGGHLDPDEIDDPQRACYREIAEETGIVQDEITGLVPKYILIRAKGSEIRQQFVYFGRTEKQRFVNTDEGELHWIAVERLDPLAKPWIIQAMLDHYFQTGIRTEDCYIGIATTGMDGQPAMDWTVLVDPEIV